MRLFWAVARRSFRRHLTYRAATVAGLVTNVFFGVVRAAVLVALFDDRARVGGFSVRDAITYTGLTQAMIVYLGIFGWYELMNTVYRGEIASDLLRPMNLFAFWLAQDLGRAAVAFALRGCTIMLVYALAFDITVPRDASRWAAVLASLLLGWLLSFAFRFLVNLAAFWSPDARGIGRFAFTAGMFACGFLMPLRFFPAWVQDVVRFTPFPSMLNTIVEVYLGVLRGPALAAALLEQAAWALALVAAAQVVLRFGARRLVILGG